MGILGWIIFGGLVGWIASIITGDNDRQGIFGNILIGIVGAFLGGLVASLLGFQGITGFNFYSFLIAIVGAVVILALVNPAKKQE